MKCEFIGYKERTVGKALPSELPIIFWAYVWEPSLWRRSGLVTWQIWIQLTTIAESIAKGWSQWEAKTIKEDVLFFIVNSFWEFSSFWAFLWMNFSVRIARDSRPHKLIKSGSKTNKGNKENTKANQHNNRKPQIHNILANIFPKANSILTFPV